MGEDCASDIPVPNHVYFVDFKKAINLKTRLRTHRNKFASIQTYQFFRRPWNALQAYLGALLHACRVFSVILLGWFTLELWPEGCMGFFSSEEDARIFLTLTGVEGKSLIFTGVLDCTVGLLGSVVLLGGVASTGLGTGETTLGV